MYQNCCKKCGSIDLHTEAKGKDKNSNLFKAQSLDELLQTCPKNQIIGDNLVRAWSKINSPKYKKIVCSISGGSDSDVMLDIVWRCDKDNKVEYVWFDTGLEYQATKDHLKYLENKYGIEIKPYRAIKPIPLTCKQYGQPFLSKNVSKYIAGLQRHNFKWKDESYEQLQKKYPNCDSYLKWWCNKNTIKSWTVGYNKWLKEFLIENPPTFYTSSKCCDYAKKMVAHKLISENDYDLNIVGVRKSEGGIRATSYKTCFNENASGCDDYRPLFWYKNEDKKCYVEAYGIEHSKCYTVYGFVRTGCVGCPFNQDIENDLAIIEKYEPKLYKAVMNVFGDSYEYTRAYRSFCEKMDKKYGSYSKYLAKNADKSEVLMLANGLVR